MSLNRRGFTQSQVEKVLELQGYLCMKCGCDLRETGYHRDHISGDENDNKTGNLQLLCPTCNLEKGGLSDEYAKDLQWSIEKIKEVLSTDIQGSKMERVNDAIDLLLKSSYRLNRMQRPVEKIMLSEDELKKKVDADAYIKAYTEGFKAGLAVIWERK